MSDALLFEHEPSGSVFKIDAKAVAMLRAHCQHTPEATEAGGILIGRYIASSGDVVCDTVTEPFETDERTRRGFVRQKEPHSTIVRIVWEVTEGRVNALGNWHTHAEPDPTPSIVDIADWAGWMRDQLAKDDPGTSFFVIVGTERVRAWAGFAETGRIEQLVELGRSS